MALILDRLAARLGSFRMELDARYEVAQGEVVAILGPSGAGKSTLLNCIAGFVPLQKGRIILDPLDITRLAPEKRRTAYVFQRSYLFPHLSVRENIEFALRIGRWAKVRRDDEVLSLSQALEIQDLLDRRVSEISEGQAQRVSLARALAPRFDVLLLDEPFSALDERNRMLARHLVLDRARAFGTQVLMVTHHWEDAEFATSRAWWMASGKIQEEIEVDKLKTRKKDLAHESKDAIE